MGVLKRITASRMDANQAKYQRMDALQRDEVIRVAVEAALVKMDKHFPGANNGGIGDQMAGELHTFIDGQLERRFGDTTF